MKALFSKFMSLPIPGKAMLGMAVSGGVFGVLWLMGPPFKGIAPYVGVAMIVLTVVLSGFALLMEGRSKKKAKEVEAGLAENASASPAGVSKVEDRAALDRLRGQFEKGITTFKDYGKDLYSMPWYVVVGEPGSGKTEAIRHSGIGFPPGLQDQLQGTGGTVNMNWWFTDKAVLLDTAGRLLFEDVAPGENNEWREFLRLLRSSRPNCPINGMLLVIPADTLITDTTDELQQKAGKIAQQFDQIQRSLGVRFPVFVLITKSDLINGFREFFDDITDPVLSAQMLGWSNPDGLDEPFGPDRVEEHLETIRSRLLERRFALMQDPVHSTDAKGRRIDQVDALYKFPEALTEIGPRLRRYLEMIFVSGEWSQKPLFLRGIYFTSSMREGEALDAALAETLGVSVDSLPSSGVMKIERSYFLRDVFLDKVFKESRLVTRAANAGQVKRKRSLVMIGAGVAAALVIGVATYLSWSQTQRQIGEPNDLWTNVWRWTRAKAFSESDWEGGKADKILPRQDLISKSQALISFGEKGASYEGDSVPTLDYKDDGSYDNNSVLVVGGVELTPVTVFTTAKRYYERSSGSGGMYALLSTFADGDVFKEQLETQKLLFERLAFGPAAEGARRWLDGRDAGYDTPLAWDAEQSPARAGLAAMLSLEIDRASGRKDGGAAFGARGFEGVFELAMGLGVEGGGPAEDSLASLPELAEYFDWLYSAENIGSDVSWPPTEGLVESGTEASREAVTRGVDRFVVAMSSPSAEGTLYGSLKAYQDASAAFDTHEAELRVRSLTLGAAKRVDEYERAKAAWLTEFGELQISASKLAVAFEAVSAEFGTDGLNAGVTERAKNSVAGSAVARYDELLGVFESGDAIGKLQADEEANAALLAAYKKLVGGKNEVNGTYGDLVVQLVRSINAGFGGIASGAINGGVPAFQRRMGVYGVAKGALDGDGAEVIGGNIADRLAEIRGELNGDGADAGARGRIEDLVPDAERAVRDPANPGPISPSADAAIAVLDAVGRFKTHGVIAGEIETLSGFDEQLRSASLRPFEAVPFSTLGELGEDRDNGKYSVDANRSLIADFDAINNRLSPASGSDGDGVEGVLDRQGLEGLLKDAREQFDRHLGEYARFWSRTVIEHLVPSMETDGLNWRAYQKLFPDPEGEIKDTAERVREALAELKGYGATDETARARIEEAMRVASLAEAEHGEIESDGDLRGDIRQIESAWTDLSSDSTKARNEIVTGRLGNSFLRKYMPLGSPTREIEHGPEEEYFAAVSMLGLRLLVDESAGKASEQIMRAREMSRRFPVTLDASPSTMLSPDEIGSLAEMLGSVLSSSPESASQDEDDLQLTRDEEINDLLRVLTGGNLLDADGGAVRVRLNRAKAVVDALHDLDKFEVSIAFYGALDDDNKGFGSADSLRSVKVTVNGDLLGSSDEITAQGFRRAVVREVPPGYEFDCPNSGELMFEFIRGDTDLDRPWTAELRGYSPLAALAGENSKFSGEDVWPYVLEVRRDAGEVLQTKIGFVFKDSGLIGLRKEWPRVADWTR